MLSIGAILIIIRKISFELNCKDGCCIGAKPHIFIIKLNEFFYNLLIYDEWWCNICIEVIKWTWWNNVFLCMRWLGYVKAVAQFVWDLNTRNFVVLGMCMFALGCWLVQVLFKYDFCLVLIWCLPISLSCISKHNYTLHFDILWCFFSKLSRCGKCGSCLINYWFWLAVVVIVIVSILHGNCVSKLHFQSF